MYRFCTSIQVRQMKTKINIKDKEIVFSGDFAKIFVKNNVHTMIYTRKYYGGRKTIPMSIFNKEAYVH